MSDWMIVTALGAAAFLLGSIPFGLLISKAYGVSDLQEKGSGNIGATNVSRVVGFWPAGFLTFALDALKGVLLILPLSLGWVDEGAFKATGVLLWSIGLLSVIGHCYSPWLRFHGGKGVATAFGVILALAPWCGIIGGVVFGMTYLVTRVGAAGSLLGLLAAISVYRLFYPFDPSLLIFAAMLLISLYRHEENLDRMLAASKNRS